MVWHLNEFSPIFTGFHSALRDAIVLSVFAKESDLGTVRYCGLAMSQTPPVRSALTSVL